MMISKPGDTLVNDHHSASFEKASFDKKLNVTERDKVIVLFNAVILIFIAFKITYFFKISETFGLQQALLFGVV